MKFSETINIGQNIAFDVEFDYEPPVQTNEINDPESLEIYGVHYYGDLLLLFDMFFDRDTILDAIAERIRETH